MAAHHDHVAILGEAYAQWVGIWRFQAGKAVDVGEFYDTAGLIAGDAVNILLTRSWWVAGRGRCQPR